MGRLRTQDYWCPACDWRDGVLLELPPDVPYSMDSCPPTHPCPSCGGEAERTFSAPAPMTVALPDGTDRGDTWKLAKMQAKLKLQRKRTRLDKRGDVNAALSEVQKDLQKHSKPDRFHN